MRKGGLCFGVLRQGHSIPRGKGGDAERASTIQIEALYHHRPQGAALCPSPKPSRA